MKTRIKELNTALQHLDSDTWDNQLLPKLTEDDPFSEVFESINKLSEKVKESNKWFHKFEEFMFLYLQTCGRFSEIVFSISI